MRAAAPPCQPKARAWGWGFGGEGCAPLDVPAPSGRRRQTPVSFRPARRRKRPGAGRRARPCVAAQAPAATARPLLCARSQAQAKMRQTETWRCVARRGRFRTERAGSENPRAQRRGGQRGTGTADRDRTIRVRFSSRLCARQRERRSAARRARKEEAEASERDKHLIDPSGRERAGEIGGKGSSDQQRWRRRRKRYQALHHPRGVRGWWAVTSAARVLLSSLSLSLSLSEMPN